MRIIFLSDVRGSGQAGEVKEVKNGYARNYLLPKQLATLATHDQLQRLEAIRKAGEERRLKEEQEMSSFIALLGETTVNLSGRVGPTGKFYGTVTSAHVADELNRLTQREFDRRAINIATAIQEPGEYQAEVRFPQGHIATIKLNVVGKDAQGRTIGPNGEVVLPVAKEAPAEAPPAATEAAAPVTPAAPEASPEA